LSLGFADCRFLGGDSVTLGLLGCLDPCTLCCSTLRLGELGKVLRFFDGLTLCVHAQPFGALLGLDPVALGLGSGLGGSALCLELGSHRGGRSLGSFPGLPSDSLLLGALGLQCCPLCSQFGFLACLLGRQSPLLRLEPGAFLGQSGLFSGSALADDGTGLLLRAWTVG